MNILRRPFHKDTTIPFLKKHKLLPIILLVWLLFSAPFFFKGLIPMPTQYLVTFFPPWNAFFGMPVKNNAMPDILTQIYPWKWVDILSLQRGVLPLWNPYSFAGTVHAANYQSAAFSPLNFLFFLFSPTTAWSLLVLLQPLLAGIFMYLFLQLGLKRSAVAAIIGSVAFMFCGFLTVWMGYATLGYAVLVTPLILLAILKWYESPSWWWGVLLSLSLLFSFFSGHFQMSLYVLGVAMGYAIYLYFQKRLIRHYIGIVAFIITGVLLAVPQLVISFDAFAVANRNESFIINAGIPWRYLLTLFAPDFYGNPVTRNDWFGQYAEWASYIGVVPLFLALLGLLRVKKNALWFFLAVGIGSLLLATVSPVSYLFYLLKIPVLSTSVATRTIIFLSFSLCVFAAYGWDGLMEDFENKQILPFIRIAGMSIAVVGLIWLVTFIFRPLPADKLVIAQRNLVLPTLLLVISILVTFGAFQIRRLRITLAIFFLLFVTFDMYRYASKWMPFDPSAYVYPQLPVISYLKEHAEVDRVFGNAGSELHSYFGIPSIEGYDAMYQARYGEFISAAGDGTIRPLERSVVRVDRQGKFTKRWLDLLGVRYILHRQSDGRNIWVFPHWNYEGMVPRYHDDRYDVFENIDSLPRALLASSYKVIDGKQGVIDALIAPDLDLRKTVVVEQQPAIEPQEGESKLQIQLYHPERVLVRIETDVPKILFLSDVYDNGWTALINGKKTPIMRANYAFRAVAVPSGTSTVEFYYAPERLRRAVSLALFIGFVLLAGSVRKLITYGRRYLQSIS